MRRLKAGDKVFTILRHCSRSGMFRVVDAVVFRKGQPINIRGFMNDAQWGKLTGWYKYDLNREGFKMGGCGMDMGFKLVYDISTVLFPHGFTVSDRTGHKNGAENGKHDLDGGYALRQAWL